MLPYSPLFETIEDFVVTFFHYHPLIGPMTLLFAEEAGIPLPVPGDIYIAYVGFEISRGVISFHLAFFLLFIGVLAGSSILFYLSYLYGQKIVLRFGKYIHLNERKLVFLEKQFRKYGPLVIIFGRHIPGFRIPITIFSGIAKIDYKVFIASEAISVIAWILIFMKIGQTLGRDTQRLFHNHYAFLLFLLIPITLTIITVLFGKFIPEDKN